MLICTYKPDMQKQGRDPDFFVNRVGKAGKPTRKAQALNNSFAVWSADPEVDFLKCLVLYQSGLLKPITIGSVIPFIRIRLYKKVVAQFDKLDYQHCLKASQVNQLIELKRQELATAEALALQLNRSICKDLEIMQY